MSRPIDQNTRNKAIEMVRSGISKTETAKILGIGTTTVSKLTKSLGRTLSFYSQELIEEILARIEKGEKAAALARKYGMDKACICLWQKKKKGIGRVHPPITDETKAKALELYAAGHMYTEIGRRLNVGPAAVRYWAEKAIQEGTLTTSQVYRKHGDLELIWVLHKHPQYFRWREFAVEWLKGEIANAHGKVTSLRIFFEKYLAENNLPVTPEEILKRGVILPDFFKTCCPQSIGGITYNNHLHDFIAWTLLNYFSIPADDGSPIIISTFRNPLPRLSTKGFPSHYESVQTPLPYGYIHDLRKMLAQGSNFKDWKWAQGALGVKREGEFSKRSATDWYAVDERLIDDNDPDCVYRYRKSVDPKSKPILEMWSPVRWVALLIKLQLPPRSFQVRMLDSGEADFWRYDHGEWIVNPSTLATGTLRKPLRQGVLRRVDTGAKPSLYLYFNTNKTADIAKGGSHKGYEFPWPVMGDLHDQPHYWLEKLRNWQEKYNPLERRTSWRELPKRCFSDVKTEFQLASYPDTCFLFRSAERSAFGESSVPITDGMLSVAWSKLLETMQIQLAEKGMTHADGSAIELVVLGGNSSQPLFPLHSLRVSLITSLAIEGGLPFHILTKLVGHSRLIMTLYYTKPGFKHFEDALIGAADRMDQAKEKTIISFLSNSEYQKLLDEAIWNSPETPRHVIPEYPGNRNPAGWLPMHLGICIVGGNTSEIESNPNVGGFRLGGCHNGGPALNSGTSNRVYRPVPGGPRNCVRCRWLVTEPHYLPALTAHLGNVCYHFDEARELAVKLDGKLHDLKRRRVESENSDEIFSEQGELLATERQWEASMQRFNDFAEDMVACWSLIQRCYGLTKREGNNVRALVAVGDAMDIQVGFEEIDSELLQLSGVCQNVEIYPDLQPGKAILRRSQLLDAALMHEKSGPFFLQLSEDEQLRVGNAFMRHLSNMAHPNPLIGIRHACSLVDSGKSLADFLGLDVKELLSDLTHGAVRPLQFELRK